MKKLFNEPEFDILAIEKEDVIVMSTIEDEEDIRAADKAMAAYRANPVSCPHDEFWARMGV